MPTWTHWDLYRLNAKEGTTRAAGRAAAAVEVQRLLRRAVVTCQHRSYELRSLLLVDQEAPTIIPI